MFTINNFMVKEYVWTFLFTIYIRPDHGFFNNFAKGEKKKKKKNLICSQGLFTNTC